MVFVDPLFLLQNVPDGRMFGLDQQTFVQMVILIINVAVLALILSKLLYEPILKVLNDRKARILDEVESAEKNKADALQLKADYEQAIKGIEQEKYDILDAARKQATEMREQQIAEARNEAEAVKARARKDVEMEQERAKSEMKQAVISASSAIAAKFLARNIDADTHEQLFNETMAELEEIAWHN